MPGIRRTSTETRAEASTCTAKYCTRLSAKGGTHVLRLLRLPLQEIRLHTEAAGFAPPDAFGPFRVLHQIGAGALGPVFRAFEPDRDRLVAVKLFRLDLPPERVHQLVGEFERLIAVDLQHPVIAAPRATGIDGVSAYLAQDFAAADSLDIVIRENGPAPLAEALRVAALLEIGRAHV